VGVGSGGVVGRVEPKAVVAWPDVGGGVCGVDVGEQRIAGAGGGGDQEREGGEQGYGGKAGEVHGGVGEREVG
jgi:hypothetical protein